MKQYKSYIFITTEGFTYQPGSEAASPDIENMQVLGFGEGITAKLALNDMLFKNKYLRKTNFNEVIAILLKGNTRENLVLKNSK